MTAFSLSVSSALAAIAAALLFAIRAREAERDSAGLGDRLASALREAERLRRLCRESDAALAATREELRQARLALSAADAELERRNAATGENGENGKGGGS